MCSEAQLKMYHGSTFAKNQSLTCINGDTRYVDYGVQDAELVPYANIDENDGGYNDDFLSDCDEELREVRKNNIQGNENNDHDVAIGAKDHIEFNEEYDSDNPPNYETDDEDSITKVGECSSKVKYPSYNPQAYPPVLEVELLFEVHIQFKNAIINYVVYTNRELIFTKNDTKTIRVKCVKNCPFYCYGCWINKYRCFQLRRITNVHKCNTSVKLGIVSQKWIEEKYEDKITGDPSIGIMELEKHIEADLKITLSISMVRRAIKAVVNKVNARFEDQFRILRDYAQECLNTNPGSTLIVKTERIVPDAPCVFQRIYVCFEALKSGFLEGCRKVIGLDGCFLKGLMKGEILSVVARDANNQMYPVAWAIVENENTDLDMTNSKEWTLISDQQKGLSNVIHHLFPEAEHRNCARHIHTNWSKNHRGMIFKKLFWKCAKSTTQARFEGAVQEMEKRDPKASEDLKKYPARLWCKAFFRTTAKCDAVDNNLSETFNGTILKARSKPIVPMLEDIRVAVMRRIAEKCRFVEKWKGNHGPIILEKLNQNVMDSVRWHVDFNGVDGFEIKKGKEQFKVKLQSRTCSCRAWDLSGIPCVHAICAIYDRKKDPEDFIDDCYSKEMYVRTYSHALEPINGQLYWPKTLFEEIGAHVPRKMRGRPRKKRNREVSEPRPTSKTKMSRKGGIISCSMCKQVGHNKRFYPSKSANAQSPTGGSSSARKSNKRQCVSRERVVQGGTIATNRSS